jgi:hypothetical protein
MSLRIGAKGFFSDTLRTRNIDTSTNTEQSECENYVDKIFHDFLNQQSSYGMK